MAFTQVVTPTEASLGALHRGFSAGPKAKAPTIEAETHEAAARRAGQGQATLRSFFAKDGSNVVSEAPTTAALIVEGLAFNGFAIARDLADLPRLALAAALGKAKPKAQDAQALRTGLAAVTKTGSAVGEADGAAAQVL